MSTIIHIHTHTHTHIYIYAYNVTKYTYDHWQYIDDDDGADKPVEFTY